MMITGNLIEIAVRQSQLALQLYFDPCAKLWSAIRRRGTLVKLYTSFNRICDGLVTKRIVPIIDKMIVNKMKSKPLMERDPGEAVFLFLNRKKWVSIWADILIGMLSGVAVSARGIRSALVGVAFFVLAVTLKNGIFLSLDRHYDSVENVLARIGYLYHEQYMTRKFGA